MRGKWVMEVLLGSPPPPPPPNVPALEETKGTSDTGRALTVRERMEQHRSNPQCTSCHRVIDPLGLALENFDATGKWRIRDGGMPVDTSGQLFDGTSITGSSGLRDALLRHQDVVLLSFTRSLMTYALGRRVEAADMPAVRRIIRNAAAQNYRISAFVTGIVESDAFRLARLPQSQRQQTTDAQGQRVNMFVTRQSLSRRTLLKGLGATVALPMLDAMMPAGALAQNGRKPIRLIAMEMVHGAAGSTAYGIKKNMWSPAATGSAFDLSPTSLKSLEPYRDYLTIVSNTDVRNAEAFAASEIGADHFRSAAVFLTQAKPKQTQGSDVLRRHVVRSDLRAEVRRPDADSVDAAVHRERRSGRRLFV